TVSNVSFLNPDQSIVTVVINQTSSEQKFHVVSENRQFEAVIPAKTVATYKWKRKK
ncbi:glycoside hydrolase family 30 beta sandwich domain-containing protein, partial [Bacillus velezensis]